MPAFVTPALVAATLRVTLLGLLVLAGSRCGPGEEPTQEGPAIRGDRSQAEPLVQRAKAALDQDRLPEARTLLDQALVLDPGWAEAHWIRGQLLSRMGGEGNLPQALEDIHAARADWPENLDMLAGEARVRDQLGQSRPTIDLLEDLLERAAGEESRREQRAWARNLLGRLLLREDDVEGAERHLQRLEEEGQGGPESALGLARVARARDQLGEWERWIDLSLDRAPLNLQAHRERQQLLQRTARPEEAEREKEIQELLRVLVQDSSTRFTSDVPSQARLWGELAEYLPDVATCRIQQVRLLDQCKDYEELRRVGPAILQGGLRHVDVIGLVALAQARGGQIPEALRTASLLQECQPPPPPRLLNDLRRQIRALEQGS